MSGFLYRCVYRLIHVTLDLAIYRLPRVVNVLLVRLPMSVIEVLGALPVESRQYASGADRRIRIITAPYINRTSSRDEAAAAQDCHKKRQAFLVAFGLPTNSAALERAPVRRGVLLESYEGPLYGGHMGTILGAFRPLPPSPTRHREEVQSYDGCRVCLDFFYPSSMSGVPDTPSPTEASAPTAFVLILPGLTGSSKEFYVQRMLRVLLPMNIAVAVLNARGVADTPLDTPQIFSAIFTQDIRYILQHHLTRNQIRDRLGAPQHVPVMGIAFSLGGLILSNFVSEQGEAGLPSGLDGVITLCTPHNVTDCDVSIRRPVSQLLYGPSTSGGLRRYYHNHKEMLEQLPGVDATRVFGRDAAKPRQAPLIERMKSVYEFDHDITAPHFGFDGAVAYYSYANNFRRLGHSQTAQVCVVARNDPFCGPVQPCRAWETVALEHKAGLACVELPVGGHMGFLGDPITEMRGGMNEMERCVEHMVGSFVHAWYARPEEHRRALPSCPEGAVVPRDTPATKQV